MTSVLESLRRLWCNATLQSRLVLELQTMDSQACIGKNRGPRLSKSNQDTCWFKYSVKRRECTKRLEEIGG